MWVATPPIKPTHHLPLASKKSAKKKLVRHLIGVVVDHKIHCVGRKLEFPSMKRDTPMLDSKPSVEDRFQPDDDALNLFVYQ